MKILKCVLFAVATVFLLLPLSLQAAQSTADVTATADLKEKTRKEVLGSKAETIKYAAEYVVGFGDYLKISVYGEGDMAAAAGQGRGGREDGGGEDGVRSSAGVKVRMDGRISLKHIGDVEVAGMTLTQLADYLKKIYATVFHNPVVTTVLEQSNSRRYTVMGKVTSPGIFHLDYPINLVQVVARCGGFNEWANNDITVVRKNIATKDKKLFKANTLSFDYDDFLKGKELERNILVQADDIIISH